MKAFWTWRITWPFQAFLRGFVCALTNHNLYASQDVISCRDCGYVATCSFVEFIHGVEK